MVVPNIPVSSLKNPTSSPKHTSSGDHSYPLTYLFNYLKLLLSGDIHPNPGPNINLRICHINCRSFSAEKKPLIEAQCNNYDILTLSETWFKEKHSHTELDNFHKPFRRDRDNDAGYGGVAVYIRNTLYAKHRPDLQVTGLEAVWAETRINHEPYLIGSFYRPPDARVRYWDLIAESIFKANSTNHKFIILGDFNDDFNRPSQHLLNLLNRFDLIQLTNSDTRITDNTSNCLDLILTQSRQFVEKVEVHPEICSDHCVPCITVKNHTTENTTYKRTFFQYNKLRTVEFQTLLSNINWPDVLNDPIQSIHSSAENFCKILFDTACKCMPFKTVTVRTRDKPWVNAELKAAFKRRFTLFKRAKQTNSDHDWETYRRFRNQCTNMVRQMKKKYENDLDEKISNNANFATKDFYKLVKTFLSKKGQSDEIPPLEHEGNIYYSNTDKANILNNHFIKQSSLQDNDDGLPVILISNHEITTLTITANQVKSVIKNLDRNKASGPDQVHNILLKYAVDILGEPLALFFNRCISLGVFPNCWKLAYVTPILKKNPAEICTNYRPISLLSCVGKLFERCVHIQVFDYLTQHSIITESQSGFLPNDSTVNQLLVIYDNLCKSFDNKVTSQSVFFDISKAFDKVWHRGLLHKLYAIGIRGSLLEWFTSYLSDRRQCVVIKGKKSDIKPVTAGVPQGSVLGPLLFLIYINDITHNITSTIKLFADDTSMSLAINNPDTRSHILNTDLQKIEQWAKTWKVTFNAEKTELLTIKRDNFPNNILTFENANLVDLEYHKHLGVFLQNDCKWNIHINNLIKKVTPLISCLKSFKYRLSRKSLDRMYKSFILPIFDYADILYNNCTEELSQNLENLHLEAIRIIIGGVKGTSHHKLYKESGLTSLKERRRRHILIMFHKIIHNHCPNHLRALCPPLMSQQNQYQHRRPYDRRIPRCKTTLYINSFIPSAIRHHNNSLPDDIKSNPSISALKHFLTQKDPKVPTYYLNGKRKNEIIHTRLRLSISDLNDDLVARHIQLDRSCSCGYHTESAEHFLLHCPQYDLQRNATINLLPTHHLNLDILLSGSPELSCSQNRNIFDKVQEFIENSNRFLI